MQNMVLFETTESVIEVLWDVALAFFVTRLALVYFAVVFVPTCLISYLATCNDGSLLHRANIAGVVAAQLLVTALAARGVVVHFQLPHLKSLRLAIGGVALGFMLGARALVAAAGWSLFVGGGRSTALLLAVFAAMPALMMALERNPAKHLEEGDYHHETGLKGSLSDRM
ncbi:uncharacterized protein E0L32_003685 [Thyridium curvatum]|uniref:Uncharacterized protein n=1 Tax=Thyridium curvatum TaxID=1093900 RepID=A0A507BDH7_9PEZI|nr:uncharacterized protein E0L32_003685 [Thyridium curvatum]TPX16744.1 hypothetical protein E0L32_003685 [Thyridium curvatum]